MAEHFINAGYGWTCKHCRAEDEASAINQSPRARFFTEGEAEEREPKLSAPTLARWRDATRRILVCPRCGVEERIEEKSRA